MGVYSPAQHWHRVEGALADLGEEGTRVIRDMDNTSVSLAWVMEDISAEGKQTIDKHGECQPQSYKEVKSKLGTKNLASLQAIIYKKSSIKQG